MTKGGRAEWEIEGLLGINKFFLGGVALFFGKRVQGGSNFLRKTTFFDRQNGTFAIF
jgi:hypothetical protein